MLGNLKQFSILEITYGIIFLVFLFYVTQSYNINLLQFTLVVSVVIFIIYISIVKKEDLKNLKEGKLTKTASLRLCGTILYMKTKCG